MSERPTSTRVPSFAVVGHPNKGKSSIVATLAEEDDIAVSAVPGTTRRSREFGLVVDGQKLYQLVDTPGFQRAGELWEWLQSGNVDAASRPARVAEFLQRFADDPRFQDEVELLQPIVAGCGILYVVDGTKPYGPEYEVEMEILRWTGQPRMALINMIGDGDFVAQWQEALGQYFSIVRQFDAMYADFDTRIGLLNAFAELDQTGKSQIRHAVEVLREERARRLQLSAEAISQCLVYGLTAVQTQRLAEDEAPDAAQARLEEKLKTGLARSEAQTRKRIEDLYRHFRLASDVDSEALIQQDLFASESWQVFGLSRQQLLVTGALSGAVAGSGLDLMLGGASLMLGAGIGATLGGVGAWLGATELAKVKVLGQALGGRVLQVGPVQDINFPWVLLGRAWLHHQLVSERNHARREALAVDAQQAEHHMDKVGKDLRRRLQRCFNELRSDSSSAEQRAQLTDAVAELLSSKPKETSGSNEQLR